MAFQDLLNGILQNCVMNFNYGGKSYELSDDCGHNAFILAVNFGFGLVLAFLFMFGIRLMKWCVRKCLRK